MTASVRLEQNLRCPDTNGLVIGAHGITVNLNGHGIHQGIGFRGPGSAIDNTGGYDGVVIRNGGLARNWVVDTRPVFSPDDTTGDGIRVGAFTAGTVIRENIAVRNGEDGIDVESSGVRLIRNLANDNTDLGIDARPGAVAAGNQAAGNGDPRQCAGISCG